VKEIFLKRGRSPQLFVRLSSCRYGIIKIALRGQRYDLRRILGDWKEGNDGGTGMTEE